MAIADSKGTPMRADHPVPVLGALTVERRSTLGSRTASLAGVPVGVGVSGTAEISAARAFAGRVALVVEDESGNSGVVTIESSKAVRAFQAVGVSPAPGVRVQFHGTVTQPVGNMPKGIEAYALRVVA
ncbi:hypothetical protein ACFWH4_01195 [Streptomyces sp. NPDC127091]|uniref:hypothetical protein n=1 Tax=Streptomyces sp. NPDC127091 TaxID=3347134 RepID=UPI0036671318